MRNRTCAITFAVLFAANVVLGGEGVLYLDSYNTLVRMIESRCEVVGLDAGDVTVKDPSNPVEASVTWEDMAALRTVTGQLLDHFVLLDEGNLGPWSTADAVQLKAFPSLAAAQGKAILLIPAHLTANGIDVRSDTYVGDPWRIPVLWEQLEDLHVRLASMRYTLQSGTWSTEGEVNKREGVGAAGDFAGATQGAEAAFEQVVPYSSPSEPPRFYTRGVCELDGDGIPAFMANIVAIRSRYAVEVAPALPCRVHTYVYTRTYDGTTLAGLITSQLWDAYGLPVGENRWSAAGAADGPGRVVSPWIGPTVAEAPAFSPWCDAPGNPVALGTDHTSSARGFEAYVGIGIVEWTALHDETLRRPSVEDSDEDGIVFAGCDCKSCPPGADPAWRDMEANPACRFPMGVSRGLDTGGLRVQAYVTESHVRGVNEQLLNVDSTARILREPNGAWTFALVRRPGGAEVLIGLTGDGNGAPLNTTAAYRMQTINASAYELTFPGEKPVTHRFDATGASGETASGTLEISQVRMISDGVTLTAKRSVSKIGTDTIVTWPGLTIVKLRGSERVIKSVASSANLTAVPVYGAGGLIAGVTYRDSTWTAQGALDIESGSRVFIQRDGVGAELSRLVVAAGADVGELREIALDGALARRVRRAVSAFDGAGIRQLRQTTWTDPGGPDAHSNATETVITAFPWGTAITEHTVGAGTDAAQTTRYAFGSDPADANAYGRLGLEEFPDGGWTRYGYDAEGRVTAEIAPFGDAAPTAGVAQCRAVYSYYAGDPLLPTLGFPADDVAVFNDRRPRLVVETALGHEVARSYTAYRTGERVEKRCREPGARYDAPSNLTTTRKAYISGTFAGRPASIAHPDGTFTRFTYSYDSAAQRLTIVRETGAGSEAAITNGTRAETVIDAARRTLTSTTRDIASGQTLAQMLYTRDVFGRSTREEDTVSGAVRTQAHGCCGVEETVDADGSVTRFDYTDLKQVLTTMRGRLATTRRYDSFGNVTDARTTVDGDPVQSTLSVYDGAGRLVEQTDPAGAITRYAYDTAPGGGTRVTTTFDDGGTQSVTSWRDGHPRAVSGTATVPACTAYGAAPGETWTTEYAGADTNAARWVRTVTGMLDETKRVEHPGGYTVTYTYDDAGREVGRSDDLRTDLTAYNDRGEPWRHAVDMNGNGVIDLAGPDRVTETEGRVAVIGGEAVREAVTRVYADAGSAAPIETAVSRQALDGTRSWSSAFGRTNETVSTRDRDQASREDVRVEPHGSRTVACYTNGLLLHERRVAGDGETVWTRSWRYDGQDRLSAEVANAANGEMRETAYDYDGAGRITNVTETAGALRRETRYAYDIMGRRTATMLPDGGVVSYAYSQRGELLEQSGARIIPVRYAYDALGRLASLSTFREGLDGPADTTQWVYDTARGWLTAKRYTDGSEVQYVRRADGSLAARRWARGVETYYDYDPSGAVTNTTHSDATPAEARTYDRRGQLLGVRDAAGVHTLSYHVDGALATVSSPQAPDTVLDYAYDAFGRMTNLAMRAGAVETFHTGYGFDAAGRLSTVDAGGPAIAYSYASNGLTVDAVARGDLLTEKTFDGFERLIETETRHGASIVHRSAYTLNAADQRVRQTLADGRYWIYAYDALGQLVSGRQYAADGAAIGGRQFLYAYDEAGNRVQARNFRGQRTQTSAYAANGLNQIEQRTVPGEVFVTGEAAADARVSAHMPDDAAPTLAGRNGAYFWAAVAVSNDDAIVATTNLLVTAVRTTAGGNAVTNIIHTETRTAIVPRNPETFIYDADGNLLEDGLWTYTWDAENRLVKTESLPSVPDEAKVMVVNLYDYMGRRVLKTVSGGYSGGTYTAASATTYVWDGFNIIAEMCDAGHTNWYTYGLDLSGTLQGAGGVGGALTMTRDAGTATDTYLYCFDGNGNVVNLVDASDGSIVATYEYSPFGSLIRSTGPMSTANPVRWSTKHTDDETGLVMYPKRPYAPTFGRFITRDPADLAGGINLYAYCANNPISRIDILGLWGKDVHYAATKRWARSVQYPEGAAEAIGLADEEVDQGATSFMPIFGDQRYHFDMNKGKGKDTRIERYEHHLVIAKWACNWKRFKHDDPETAARELGTALHPRQDWVAHGEYGRYDEGGVYTVHNKLSPQAKTWGDVTGYPDHVGLDAKDGTDGRPAGRAMHTVIVNGGVSVRLYAIYEPTTKRIKLTEKLTLETLNEFHDYLKENAGCKCKQYFGVK